MGNINKDYKLNNKKVEDVTPNNWFNAKINSAKKTERQVELGLLLFDIANPAKQYRSLRFWLDDEYQEGDVTDTFFEMFPGVDTMNQLIGKEFKVFIANVTNVDGVEKLRVTEIDSLS